jgi:NAD(P)-dependent dehydrogenase (short-subunit alcohol dehydrogenase family)
MTRTIVITGASGGIGAASAGSPRRAAGTSPVREHADGAWNRALGRGAAQAAARADVVALFDAAEQAFGRIDGVVNNAGIVAPPLPLRDIEIDRLRRIIDVNLLGICGARGLNDRVGRHSTSKGRGSGANERPCQGRLRKRRTPS